MSKEPEQYWLVKKSGEIMTVSPSHKPTDLWRESYMRLRFFHHPESDSVLYEDWYLLANNRESKKSVLHSGVVEEVTYEEWRWLKTLYDNPDL